MIIHNCKSFISIFPFHYIAKRIKVLSGSYMGHRGSPDIYIIYIIYIYIYIRQVARVSATVASTRGLNYTRIT